MLKGLLEKEPEKRLSSQQAFNHAAFHSLLSKSPLISKNAFNADALIQHAKLTEDKNLKEAAEKKKNVFDKIPDRIEDMSPLPSPSKKRSNDQGNKKMYGFNGPEFNGKTS